MKKRGIGILKVHSFCFPQRVKGSLNSKRRISDIYTENNSEDTCIKTIIFPERIGCFFF